MTRRIATVVLAAALLLAPNRSAGCGPFWSETQFSFSDHPDSPGAFARGELGIVRPTYDYRYLVVAYRQLVGKPLNAEQAKIFVDPVQEEPEGGPVQYVQPQASDETDPMAARDVWMKARGEAGAPPLPKEINPYRNEQYQDILNCSADSFRTAARTLHDRMARFGVQSTDVKAWLEGQDAVFANCSSPALTLPQPANAQAATWLRADRAYQIAAARFYRLEYDEARVALVAIAQDGSSPWREVAPYVGARALIRKALAGEKPDAALLAHAEGELRAIAADSSRVALHDTAQRLIDFIAFRLHPAERMHALSRALLGNSPSRQFAQELDDYVRLLRRDARPEGDDDMSDWLRSVHRQPFVTDVPCTTAASVGRVAPSQHARDRWQATHAPVWLVAALMEAATADPELITAALGVQAGSPAYFTARYHAARLLVAAHRNDEARQVLDELLARKAPLSAHNLVAQLRAELAQNFDEWLRFAALVPVDDGTGPGQSWSQAEAKPQPPQRLFDERAALLFNQRLGVAQWMHAASNEQVPRNLQRRLALASWTRATLLQHTEQADTAAALVARLAPELARAMQSYRAAAAAEKSFVAAFILLHHPGLRPYVDAGMGRTLATTQIDDFRENWWCSAGSPRMSNWEERLCADLNRQAAGPQRVAAPDWQHATEQQATASEFAALAKLGVAPNYLARVVTAWARAHPGDARNAEALHLAVRATRYGCTDDATTAASKAAFQLLHQRYGATTWARKTPYYF